MAKKITPNEPQKETNPPKRENFRRNRHSYDSVIRQHLSPDQARIILSRISEIQRSIKAKAIPGRSDPYECHLEYERQAKTWPSRARAAFSTTLEEMDGVFAREQIFKLLEMILDEEVFPLENLEVLGNILQKAKNYIAFSKIRNFVEKLMATRKTTRRYVLTLACATLERGADPDIFVEILAKVEAKVRKGIEEQNNPTIPIEDQAGVLDARLESLWMKIDPHLYAEAIRRDLSSEEIANLLVES